ncbi:hypothetical protein BH09ACT3_BH09ACT3_00470 [soil metagenome]
MGVEPHVDYLNPLAVPTLPDGSRAPGLAPLFADGGRGMLFTATIR